MDYGRPVEFGYFLVPDASDPQRSLRSGRLADELGLDLVGLQDHPYQSRYLDTWTLLAAIAAQTRRVRVFPDVANLPLRPPAVLAKAAASLDLLSGGRVELGLGAGSFWQGITAMGGQQRTPGESVDALEEAIQVIWIMWSGERSAWFRGRHYSLSGVHRSSASDIWGCPPGHRERSSVTWATAVPLHRVCVLPPRGVRSRLRG